MKNQMGRHIIIDIGAKYPKYSSMFKKMAIANNKQIAYIPIRPSEDNYD